MAPKNPDNRDIILDTAARLFAQHGFDATTMNQLAKEASVNKALIYYYFKDKDDILKSLFELLITRMREHTIASKVDLHGLENIDKKIEVEIDFLKDNKNTLSLLLMESMKSGKEPNMLVEIASKVIESELDSRGFPIKPKNAKERAKHAEAVVHEFFTGIMPVLAYVSLGDSFANHWNIDTTKCKKLFLKSILSSHFNSHVVIDDE